MAIQLLSVNWVHLIQSILNLFILLSANIRSTLRMIWLLIWAWGQFQIKIDSWSELVNIYSIFWRLVQIWYVCCACHEAIVVLVLRHCTIWNICIVELCWVLIGALNSTIIINVSDLVRSNWAWNYWLVGALHLMRCARHHCRCRLWLSCILRLRWLLQFFYINCTRLLFPLSLAWIVLNWCWRLPYMISFPHKCILGLVLWLVLNISLIIIIIICCFLSHTLSIFEPFLLILLIHLVRHLYILLRTYLLAARYLHLLMRLSTPRLLN